MAAALAQNPASPSAVLAEARTKNPYATHGFIALENHPNFPVYAMSNAGISNKAVHKKFSQDTAATSLFASDEVTDDVTELAWIADRESGGQGHLAATLRNPANRVTQKAAYTHLLREKTTSPEVLQAAVEGGKFPPKNMATASWRRNYVHDLTPEEEITKRNRLLRESVEFQRDEETLRETAAYLRKTDEWRNAREALVRNQATPPDVISLLKEEEASYARLLQER